MTSRTGPLASWASDGDARVRLLCFPHAGNGASRFAQWVKLLPADVELLAVRLPGRESRFGERALKSLEAVCDEVASALGVLPPKPTVIFGHCSGAVCALGIAQRLTQAAEPPCCLVVACQAPPTTLRFGTPPAAMTEAQLIADLRRFGATPDEIFEDPEALELFTPAIRADLEVMASYGEGPHLTLVCPIICVAPTGDDLTDGSLLGLWRHETQSAFTLRVVDGDHFLSDKWEDLGVLLGETAISFA